MCKEDLRVLILSTQSRTDATGVRVYCDALEKGLQAAGVKQVLRVTHQDAPAAWIKFGVFAIKACRLLGRGAQQVMNRWCVAIWTWRLLRDYRGKVDVVFAQDPVTGACAQVLGFSVWTICHFSDPIDEIFRAISLGPIAKAAIRKTMLYFLTRNARYLVLSRAGLAMMKKYAPNADVQVAPTICRIPEFLEATAHEGFRIAMMGRLEELKGQTRLVEMMEYLKDLSVELWLIGEGEEHTRLESRVGELGITDRVQFWGQQKSPEKLLSQCDLYIHSSRMEALSLAPIEAIFAGIPAWSYETPGYNDAHVFDGMPYLPQETTSETLAHEVRKFVGLSQEKWQEIHKKQRKFAKIYRMSESIKKLLSYVGVNDE